MSVMGRHHNPFYHINDINIRKNKIILKIKIPGIIPGSVANYLCYYRGMI
jgi:hypothetical protein